MDTPNSTSIRFRLRLVFLILSACPFLTGGKFISVSNISPPYDENIIFGEVIREIRLTGNEIVKDKMVYAAMRSKPGEIYTEELANLDYKWLSQLGTFTSINFETIRVGEGVILVVKLDEVNEYTPAPVFKITDENGLSVGARITSNSVLGYGTKGSAFFTVGGATNFGVRLADPWIPGRGWNNGLKLDYVHAERRNKIYEFDERSDDVFLELNQNITNQLRWGPQLMYLTVKSDEPDRTLSSNNRDHIPGAGVFLRYDSRNLPIYPTKHWWIGFNVRKYGLGGVDTNYWQVNLDVRKYFELGSAENSLALWSLGTFSTGEVGVDFPIYMQFNLGGANSVRGWSLGSRDGKNQFINTAEYWHRLMQYKKWKIWFLKFAMGLQLGAFGDVATVWSSSEEFHRNWIGGGGLGLRFLVPPIVMFRTDVAYGEDGFGVRFFLGTNLKAAAQRERVR